MGNIARLFLDDVRRLFSNAMCAIITVGLVVVPSIFAWYNVIACWNVFDNTGNLTVAVANRDEGYESDLVPLRINVGEQVVSALRANDQIDWVITDEDDAVDGARSGRYYAAVVIPEQFSRDMLTFYQDGAEHAEIVYYSNEKKSAIAPKITDTGADSVSHQVNQVFAETLAEVGMSLAVGLSNYADNADASGQLGQLASHLGELADGIDRTAGVLELYGTLTDAVGTLAGDTATMVGKASDDVSAIRSTAAEAPAKIEGVKDGVAQSADGLKSVLDACRNQIDAIEGTCDGLFDELGNASSDAAERLRGHASKLREQASAMDEGIAEVTKARDELQARIDGLDPADPDAAGLASAGAKLVAALDALADRMESGKGSLGTLADSLDGAAESAQAGDADVEAKRQEVAALVADAKSAVEDARSSYEQDIAPSLASLESTAEQLSASLASGLDGLADVSEDLRGAAGGIQSATGDASARISEAAATLREAASALRGTGEEISGALASGDADKLRRILAGDTDLLSKALSSPIGVKRVPVFPADNFGSAMAPLYTTLALFIGALLIMVVVRPQPSRQQVEKLRDPKPRQLFLGHFGVCALISLAQSTLMGLGNIFFLQVQAAHPLLLMACFWASGLVFAFIVYALVFSFANLGKAIAVLLLIVQVTGCGGSFPLQILPGFVQAISPWLPATHVVDAMRAAMFGTYGNDFWVQIGLLALFVVPFAFLGLALRKPLAKFMEWYVQKVEGSKLIC